MTGTRRHRVVIVGAGFGGLACARALRGEPVEVLVLDRQNFHLFTPLLYQVATALLNPSDIAYPLRAAFRRSPNVRFRLAQVTGVDVEGGRVRTAGGDEVPFDSLVLATGSQNDYYTNEELARHSLGMKTLAEGMRLRNHVLSCLEMAARAASPEERRAWATFVIAGGGPTGVEYAGALAELLRLVLGRDYPELDRGLARIVLVEGLARLLPTFHPGLSRYAEAVLRDLGVEVRTGSLVERATEERVTLSTGEEIRTRTLVWSAGVRPSDPLASDRAERTVAGRLRVDGRLRLLGRPNVYVIGDAAAATEDGSELPMLSPPAMQAGRYVAGEIVARALGRPGQGRPFRYVDKGTMATIGRRAAVAELRGLRMRGTIGWLVWLLVHIYYLIGFRNRVAVMASWGWNYLRRDRPIRLILRGAPDPVTDELSGGPQPGT